MANKHAPMTEQEERKKIAHHENRAVFNLRVLVSLVLVTSTVPVALMVYHYMDYQKMSLFEIQCHSNAQNVLEASIKSLHNKLGATYAFVAKIMSEARVTDQKWPFCHNAARLCTRSQVAPTIQGLSHESQLRGGGRT